MSDPNNINPSEPYRISVAERGKFWKVDDDYLNSIGYPPTGEGKYASLTYQVNPSPLSLEGDINLGQVELKDGTGTATLDIETVGTTNAVPSIILDTAGEQIEDMAGIYQNTVLADQITLNETIQSITTTASSGYIKLRISSGGSVHIGGSTVSDTTGYLLDDDYPVESLTFDDLSKVYVIGSGTLYVIGGYIA